MENTASEGGSTWIIAILFIWAISVAGSWYAGRMNRQPLVSLLMGIVLGPLGLILALMSEGTCPHCKLTVPAEATVCPRCTRDLPAT
ncbi:MAG: hypothetical protein Q8Q09_16920 [Deltaproteobacteria bacterium]|nr:hypothetical protein [Deltaproteobacteria bacterium]